MTNMSDPSIFQTVVPIGGWCRPTYQVRRHFGFTTAYPFDWLISPMAGTIAMIEDDFAQLLDPARLRLRADLDGVTCDAYGVQHKHDFLRDENHLTQANILDQLEAAKAKYKYRLDNLRRDCASGAVLFVRYDDKAVFDAHEEGGLVHRRSTYADAERLLAALTSRFPNADVSLLALNFDASSQGDPRLMFGGDAHDHGDRSTASYAGSDRGWDELFQQANIAPQSREQIIDERTDISAVAHGYW